MLSISTTFSGVMQQAKSFYYPGAEPLADARGTLGGFRRTPVENHCSMPLYFTEEFSWASRLGSICTLSYHCNVIIILECACESGCLCQVK